MLTTPDGYHLDLFHVWDKKNNGTPLFLQHGLFSSADTWIMNKEKSPAYVAAKAGYDVWLGNNRGNLYSRGHEKLNPDKDFKEFFDYSFFELGKYDAPTQINYVLKKTGYKKLSYVGHSQGTSQMFSALSLGHGNLKDKLNIFVAICPITNLHYAAPPLGDSSKTIVDAFSAFVSFNNFEELLGPNWLNIYQAVCGTIPCAALTQFFDSNPSAYNDQQVSDVSNFRTSPASAKEVIHYA